MVKSFKSFITEILDKPHEYIKTAGTDTEHGYKFNASGHKYSVGISHNSDGKSAYVAFAHAGSANNPEKIGGFDIHGSIGPDSHRVLSTVRTIMQNHAKEHGIKRYTFTSDNDEPSRGKLYHHIAKKFGGHSEYGRNHTNHVIPVHESFITENAKKNEYQKGMTAYHGTARHFDKFGAGERHTSTKAANEIEGHFFTNDQNHAYGYAVRARKEAGEGGKSRIITARLHMDNPKDVTNEIKKHEKTGLTFTQAKHKAYSGVDKSKHDGVYHRGNNYNHAEYVAFDHKHIEIQR